MKKIAKLLALDQRRADPRPHWWIRRTSRVGISVLGLPTNTIHVLAVSSDGTELLKGE